MEDDDNNDGDDEIAKVLRGRYIRKKLYVQTEWSRQHNSLDFVNQRCFRQQIGQ